MSNTTLLIVDMQNDFITGTLKNEAALETIPFIVEQINNARENAWNIVCTYDTHHNNYLTTNEGKKLPIEHCIVNTPGHELHPDIEAAIKGYDKIKKIYKRQFGYDMWHKEDIVYSDRIYVVGTCTDICVVSNVLILKAVAPTSKIIVLAQGCSGLTPELHQEALDVMKSCQVDVE